MSDIIQLGIPGDVSTWSYARVYWQYLLQSHDDTWLVQTAGDILDALEANHNAGFASCPAAMFIRYDRDSERVVGLEPSVVPLEDITFSTPYPWTVTVGAVVAISCKWTISGRGMIIGYLNADKMSYRERTPPHWWTFFRTCVGAEGIQPTTIAEAKALIPDPVD